MTLQQLEELMLLRNMTRVMDVFEAHLLVKNIHDAVKQYHPQFHDVTDEHKRPNKIIKDEKGDIQKTIAVARLPLPVQKRIVLIASAFLGCPDMESTPTPGKQEDLQTVITKIWDANKLDYKFRSIAKKTMSERHCAELWYTQDVDKSYWDGFPIDANFMLSMRVIANSLGDTLYPVFDEYGNMIAFGRGYKVMSVVEGETEPRLTLHFDVYTDDKIYMSKQQDDVWLFATITGPVTEGGNSTLTYKSEVASLKNPIGKIPVIYYSQPFVEWNDVQELIDRLEKKISNHADTNDYFDSPIVVGTGDVEGFSEKGEQGKFLQVKNGGKVEYLTWNNAPESMKMEIDNLTKFIYSFTHTPDISFENMKGLGVFSGIALKMLFLDAHLKASDKEEIFGEGVQRRINYLKKAVSVLDPTFKQALPLEIKPSFEYFLPENIAETIDYLTTAVEGGILSADSAIRLNPLVTGDAQTEIDLVNAEPPRTIAPPLTKVV